MKKILLLLFTFLLIWPLSSQAKGELTNRDEVFTFLKGGFKAQVALSEKLRTKEEIHKLLDPYFSNGFQQKFWKENIVKENGKYVTYGSDFALYYIPFYQFSNRTNVVMKKDAIYVYEYYPEKTNGPVGYPSHYEGLLLKRVSGEWKIADFFYNHIPKSIFEKGSNLNKRKHDFFSFSGIKRLFF